MWRKQWRRAKLGGYALTWVVSLACGILAGGAILDRRWRDIALLAAVFAAYVVRQWREDQLLKAIAMQHDTITEQHDALEKTGCNLT